MAMVAWLHVTSDALPLVSVQFPVHGGAGHNRWGVVETPLPVNTQNRNMDRGLSM